MDLILILLLVILICGLPFGYATWGVAGASPLAVVLLVVVLVVVFRRGRV